MKSAIVPLLLVVSAIVQALGRYVYHQDSIVVAGELFFPIFLAGVGIYYGRRAKPGAFSAVKLALVFLAILAVLLTAAGWGVNLFWFYPSIWVYYAVFALLVINAVIAVLSTPSGRELRAQRDDQEDAPADAAGVEGAPVRGASLSDDGGAPEGPGEPGEGDGGWRTARRRR